MDYLKLYKHRLGIHNEIDTPRQQLINEQEKDFEKFMRLCPNKYIGHDYFNNNRKFEINIQDVSWNNRYGDEKYFNTFNSSDIHVGDILQFEDWNNKTLWMIAENEYKTVPSHKHFKARPCTYVLRYLLPTEVNIVETPCIVDNATKYTVGIEEANRISTGNTRRTITLPKNKHTEQITRNMRFFTQYGVWVVTALDYDTTTDITGESSLIILTCAEDEINDVFDNEKEKVANYYNRNLKLEVLNISDNMKIENNQQIDINYIIKNNDEIINNFKPIITVSNEMVTKIEENKLTTLNEGNTKIIFDLGNIHQEYNIEVINKPVQNIEKTVIIGDDKLKLQRYTEFKLDKEIKDISWKVDNSSVTIKKSDNQSCILYCKNRSLIGQTIKLQVVKEETVLVEKEIKIVSVI